MRIPFIDRKELLNDQNFETEAVDESSEFLKAVGSSDRTVQMIPISRIRMNSKNGRSLAGTEVLKESIRRAGRLFEPVTINRICAVIDLNLWILEIRFILSDLWSQKVYGMEIPL